MCNKCTDDDDDDDDDDADDDDDDCDACICNRLEYRAMQLMVSVISYFAVFSSDRFEKQTGSHMAYC